MGKCGDIIRVSGHSVKIALSTLARSVVNGDAGPDYSSFIHVK